MVLFKKIIFSIVSVLTCISCKQEARDTVKQQEVINKDWKARFNQTLLLLGHRNWIVVADKAFPQQNAAGMEVINTNEDLLPVLQYVLRQVNASSHVKPIIYRDKELSFITEDQAKGVKQFANESQQLFNGQQIQTILHDSVFTKLDEASKLFKILVLKTNETIPYTSVFLQLDCAYWGADKERQLRINMNNNK
jgi:D-ribose pyranose/furanose isomerase RbsD